MKNMMCQSSVFRMVKAGRRLMTAAMALGALLLAVPQAQGAVPSTLLIEGVLFATGGGPAADGNYQVTFSIYEAKSGGAAAWSETATIALKSGAFDHALGSVKAIPAGTAANLKSAWLSVKIANEPEMPRQQMHAVIYAHHASIADSAKGLSCSGCVSVKAIKFDANAILGSHSLVAAKVLAKDVSAEGTVAAQQFIGDGSKLTGIKIPSGNCPAGKMVSGIKADGTLSCVSGASSLPKDGINEVSNDLIFNQFNDIVASKNTPVPIADNNPVGTADTIDVPDIGSAQKLTVSVDITNSDISTITVVLYDAANKTHTLYDKGNKGGKLATTFPDPSKTVKGDLGYWVGKNPKGKWRLKVTDGKFFNNKFDGAIKSWSVNIQTLSNQKIQVKADLIVDKTLTTGSFKLPADKAACTAAKAGHLRYASGKAELCDGSVWKSMAPSLFPEGSRPFLYGYHEDHLNGSYQYGSQYDGSYHVPTDMDGLHTAVRTIVWGDQHGNIRIQRGGDNYANGSNDRSQAILVALVKNTTAKNISHKVCYYYSSRGTNSNHGGIAINKSNVYNQGGNTAGSNCTTMTFPANKSSVIVQKSGSYQWTTWNGYWVRVVNGFTSDTWKLPAGLEWDYERYQQWMVGK